MEKNHTKSKKSLARQRIFDAAYRLFNRHGVHRTGIDTIIREADVAKMSFYSHFPSKDNLIQAYLKKRDDEWHALVDKHISRADIPEQKLLNIFDALEEWFEQQDFYGCPFIKGLAEFQQSGIKEIYTCITEHFSTADKLVYKLIKKAGLANPKKLAAQISLVILGAITMAQIQKNSKPAIDAKQLAKSMLEQANRGN